MADTPTNEGSSGFLLGLIAIVVLGLGGLLVFRFRAVGPAGGGPAPGPIVVGVPAVPVGDPGERFSVEERRELLKLGHEALGHLENDEWRAGVKKLDQIQAKFPEDSFATRNLAVAYSHPEMFLWSEDKPDGMKPAEAEAVAETLLKMAPQDAVSHVLAARIASKCGDVKLALQRYRRAAELDPQAAFASYELFELLRNSGRQTDESPEELKAQQIAALKKAAAASPQNLRIPVDLIRMMIETRDKSIAKYVTDLAPSLKRLRPVALERQSSTDLNALYDRALKAAELAVKKETPAEWSASAGPITPFVNTIFPLDPVADDMNRLRPNSLDFMQFRFQSPAFAKIELESAEQAPPISVKFAPDKEQLSLKESPLDVAIADYDLDQNADIWVLTKVKLQIFGWTKQAPQWHLLSEVPNEDGYTQFLATDFDVDDSPVGAVAEAKPSEADAKGVEPGDGTAICHLADSDLVLYGPAGIQVWKNDVLPEGKGRSWVKADSTGLEEVKGVEHVTTADFNHDGDLDLIIGTESGLAFWSNQEQFTFKNISDRSNLPGEIKIRQIIPVDWDRDVDLDLVVIGASRKEGGPALNGVMVNRLYGALEWKPFSELELKELGEGVTQAALLDADQNVSWDLLTVSGKSADLVLTTTRVAGQTKKLEVKPISDVLSSGLLAFDYDNDGLLDLLSWSGQKLVGHHGGWGGKFIVQPDVLPGEAPAPVQECLSADLNRDGDLDVVVLTDSGVQILANEGGNKNHWVEVRLRARTIKDKQSVMSSKRVNHQGLGSLVEMKAGGFYQPQVAAAETLHFGLGQRKSADLLRVVWTNGVPQGLLNVKGDWEVCEIQKAKGSCPFVYTWNGERYEFFTDLLWNAPLGLQFAEGVVAPARAWEYLKIPGNRLVPQGGKYVLQVTEELWEATYFDQIELLAVDHPADVDIYSNEKVGPPSLAEFKIHTVVNPRPVVAARDQRGRNVWTQIAAEDGEFTKGYDEILRQGLTTPHYLELDLGPIEQTGPLTLFLTGWMFPTETSISVAVSQNPKNAQARPPALWVPDAQGEWQEIRPFMGFPGGKTKTIAIDLTGVFFNNDHRLRIVTNMQFHWDHAFFTAGESPAEVKIHPLKMTAADLHYRGLSQHYWPLGNGPDQYDYNTVLPGPDWPPMQGKFTRFGDVRELLTAADDRLAVIGAGDEMTLTFSPPDQPVPPGWKRDFIMHNVGWDKDADLNTLYGQTVEPLPFNSMSGYPYSPQEGPADTFEYRAYLQKYQTREQSFRKFWRLPR